MGSPSTPSSGQRGTPELAWTMPPNCHPRTTQPAGLPKGSLDGGDVSVDQSLRNNAGGSANNIAANALWCESQGLRANHRVIGARTGVWNHREQPAGRTFCGEDRIDVVELEGIVDPPGTCIGDSQCQRTCQLPLHAEVVLIDVIALDVGVHIVPGLGRSEKRGGERYFRKGTLRWIHHRNYVVKRRSLGIVDHQFIRQR